MTGSFNPKPGTDRQVGPKALRMADVCQRDHNAHASGLRLNEDNDHECGSTTRISHTTASVD